MSAKSSPSYERILIAVDGGKPSEWAIIVGRQLAGQLGASVLIVNVVQPEPPIIDELVGTARSEAILKGAGAELLERSRLLFSPNTKVETRLCFGLAPQQIDAAARDWNADLIVMGTRGHSRIAQLVLGSTAEAVIRQSPCPVVAVAQQPRETLTNDARNTGSIRRNNQLAESTEV